mgnify:CR=1 FL=1
MPELLRTQKAAAMLGISPWTLRDWRLKKIGPAYIRQGRTVQYDTRDLADWFDRCRHSPTNETKDTNAH